MRIAFATSLILLLAACGRSSDAEQVGEFSNDWTGNDIVVEALHDPDVEGVTCHITYFNRSLIDRATKGNWFEDPSNSSIACRQTGPIKLGNIKRKQSGEDIFDQGRSLVFKSLGVRRIYDEKNNTLIYVAYSRRPLEGSAKMSVSTVPLYLQNLATGTAEPPAIEAAKK